MSQRPLAATGAKDEDKPTGIFRPAGHERIGGVRLPKVNGGAGWGQK